MSIKTYFYGSMMVLVGAAIATSAMTLISQEQSLEQATIAKHMTIAYKQSLQAGDALRRERGTYNMIIINPDAEIDGAAVRTAADRRLAIIEETLSEANADWEAALWRDIKHASWELASYRSVLDAELVNPAPDRRTAARARYFDELSKQILAVDGVTAQLATKASNNANPLARNLVEMTRLGAAMRNLAGLNAIMIDRIGAASSANRAGLIEQLRDLTGRIDEAWQRIRELAAQTGPIGKKSEDRVAQAIAAIRDGYFGELAPFYNLLIQADRMGADRGVAPAEMIERHLAGLALIDKIRDAAIVEAVEVATLSQESARLELIVTVGLLLLVAAVAIASIVALGRRVLTPISALTRTIFRLAENDRSLAVPELGRQDEVGDLARAIETLRENAERAATVERERQSMEVRLRHAQKLEALGTLAAGIAHEINTPAQYVGDNLRFLETSFVDFHRVLGACATLRRAAEDEPNLRSLARAVADAEMAVDFEFLTTEIPSSIAQSLDGIDRIRQIVLAVKEFSQPDVKEAAPLDLNHAIENTIAVTRNQWKYIAEMATDLAPDLPEVPCRGGEINQMLLNLIVNAAHAIEAKGQGIGTISVATALRDGWAEIRVSDTGTGIPPALIDRIFDPFFTTKDPGKGTGQGLAICHNIVVTKHGGSISVESTLGEGSCFIVRLPLNVRTTGAGLRMAA
jgi:signal transduction histidine kinase